MFFSSLPVRPQSHRRLLSLWKKSCRQYVDLQTVRGPFCCTWWGMDCMSAWEELQSHIAKGRHTRQVWSGAQWYTQSILLGIWVFSSAEEIFLSWDLTLFVVWGMREISFGESLSSNAYGSKQMPITFKRNSKPYFRLVALWYRVVQGRREGAVWTVRGRKSQAHS